MIKPVPNGKAKHTMMSLHSYKQANGACGVFGGFCKVTKKSQMSNKDVVKF
jgi:hypothetical protein